MDNRRKLELRWKAFDRGIGKEPACPRPSEVDHLLHPLLKFYSDEDVSRNEGEES